MQNDAKLEAIIAPMERLVACHVFMAAWRFSTSPRRRSSPLERDCFGLSRSHALAFCLSMIFSENRYPLFRTML
jgi:hypothetical protein